MAWEVTSKCNLKCVHCRSSSDIHSPEGKFTLDKCYRLMDDIGEFAKPVIVLSGGEPLLRKDILILQDMVQKRALECAWLQMVCLWMMRNALI